MSKSRGNVINPDDVVATYGADVFRLYEMFIGPFDQAAAWDTKGIAGIDRFIKKIWKTFTEGKIVERKLNRNEARLIHYTIKKVGNDIETLDLNTAISQMMICINELSRLTEIPKEAAIAFIKIISPFAPHIAEELWEKLGFKTPVSTAEWPQYSEELAKAEEVEILVQINGKPKMRFSTKSGLSKDELIKIALENEEVKSVLQGKNILKSIAVPDRLVNIVVKN